MFLTGDKENAEQNKYEIRRLLRDAAEKGQRAAQTQHGIQLWEDNKRGEAVEWFKRAAEQGHATSQYVFALPPPFGEVSIRYNTITRSYQKSGLLGNWHFPINKTLPADLLSSMPIDIAPS